MRATLLHIFYYIVAVAILYVGWTYSPILRDLSTIVASQTTKLTGIQEKELETFLDLTHLLLSLATAVMAGTAAVVFNRFKSGPISFWQLLRILLTSLFAASSMYFGYFLNSRVIWMLHHQFFDLSMPEFTVPQRLQFWCLIVALFSFADVFLDGLLHPQA